MIYQHVNKRAKIYHQPPSTKPIYANSLIRFTLPISMPRFKSIIFYQYSPKTKLILKKMQNFQALPPQQPPQLRISGYAPATLCTVYDHMGFRSYCFEQFFLHSSVANLMMLTIIDVCLIVFCLKSFICITHCVTLIPSCYIALSYLFAKA